MARTFQSLELSEINGLRFISGVNNVALTSTATANRQFQVPDASGSLVLVNTAANLTNTTLSSITNNVAATGLLVNASILNISTALAPSAGQVLTATSNTQLAWSNTTNLVPTVSVYSANATSTGTAPVIALSIPTVDNTVYDVQLHAVAVESTPVKAGAGAGYANTYSVRRDTGAASLSLLTAYDTLQYANSLNYVANVAANTASGNIDVTVNNDAGQTAAWNVQVTVRTVP